MCLGLSTTVSDSRGLRPLYVLYGLSGPLPDLGPDIVGVVQCVVFPQDSRLEERRIYTLHFLPF